jgi:ectoine hydroxylase-related dioxygenase (phytanoyl-CoA dioxygenase family)
MEFQHHLTSPAQGLVGIEMLTDILPGGAGTAVRVGSHAVIARRIQSAEPEGLSYTQLRVISEEMLDLPAVEITGAAGDVLWMHPYLVHARSRNVGDCVRIAANRCIVLREPMRLHRERDADYSLVERAIIEALRDTR